MNFLNLNLWKSDCPPLRRTPDNHEFGHEDYEEELDFSQNGYADEDDYNVGAERLVILVGVWVRC